MADSDPALLVGQWIHAHEEDSATARVFRKLGTPLPPSRGRAQFNIEPDFTVNRSGPGPDDSGAAGAPAVIGFGPKPPALGNDAYLRALSVDRDRLVVAKEG